MYLEVQSLYQFSWLVIISSFLCIVNVPISGLLKVMYKFFSRDIK